jgi:hypothetical protein
VSRKFVQTILHGLEAFMDIGKKTTFERLVSTKVPYYYLCNYTNIQFAYWIPSDKEKVC